MRTTETGASSDAHAGPVRENLPPLQTTLKISGHAVQAHTALNDEQQRHGFMYRRRLSRDDGLIFAYRRPDSHSFWMGNCYIDLDIAFFRADGTLINVVETRQYPNPKTDREPRSSSLEPAQYVVETNYGWFRSKGLIQADGRPNGAVKMEIPPDLWQ